MKRIYFLSVALLCLSFGKLTAQNVAVNENGDAANPSAILDVQSTSKGMLAPRMTQAQRTAITSPAKGLLVYQTDNSEGYYYNAGTEVSPNWVKLAQEKPTVAFSAGLTTSQFFPSGEIKVQFNTEEYDESGNFTTGAISEFTAPSAGIYHFSSGLHVAGGSSNVVQLSFYVNGVVKKSSYQVYSGGTYNGSLTLGSDLKLSAGDKVDVRFMQNGSGMQATGGMNYAWFNGHKVN